jgi:aminopeptidase N
MRRSLIPALVSLLVLAPGICAFEASGGQLTVRDFPDPSQFEAGSREWLRAVEALKYRPLLHDSLTQNCPHSFDVLHYDITLYIDFGLETIDGNTRVTSVSKEAGLSTIDLDLTILTVDSIFGASGPLTYVHNDPVLSINLGQAYAEDDTFEVQVYYQGQPGNEGPSGFGGFYFDGVPIHAFQMGVGLEADPPSMGKYWFPCWDWPCDKATAEYHITVGGTNRKVICNGSLVEAVIDTVENVSTYVWEMAHQIAPHCMTCNAGRFTEIPDSAYSWMSHWVFPRCEEDAVIHFENCDIMMDGFIQRYGSYPFSTFGFVSESKGDMEHQTCVTHRVGLINPDHLYDWLLAHEMAHMWWGDCVSVGDWRDVWLSEGFATYSEAVFHEHAYGMESYHNYVQNNLMNPVLSSGENFPIYDPDYLWGSTTYEKGACVLHMLRHVIGDSAFYGGLAAYRQAYEYEYAVTPEFKEAIETVSGQDLDWFFDEWIYDKGWPEYEHAWLADSVAGGYDLNLVIDQVHTNGPIFTMPVEFKITTVSGDTLVTLWVDESYEEFDLMIFEEPTAVELDPDNWILNTGQEVPHAGVHRTAAVFDLSLEPNAPNPFRPSTTIRYMLPRSQHAKIEVYNAMGQKVLTLLDRDLPAGRGEVTWNGRDQGGHRVAPGTYFCRLVTEDGSLATRMVHIR